MNVLRFLIPKSNVCYLFDDYTLRQGLEKMFYHSHHAVPVIDRDGIYIGSVSDGDFLRELYENGNYDLHGLEHRLIRDLVKRDSNPAVSSSVPIEDLMNRVKVNSFVPVTDDRGCFIGMVTRRDVINFFIDEYQMSWELEK